MMNIKEAIKEYQCPGCVSSNGESCFTKCDCGDGCGSHVAGTYMSGRGKIYLGMPTGFNRIGGSTHMPLNIFTEYSSDYCSDKYNIPVWKYLDSNGNTLVRGLRPRINDTFIFVFLGDCRDKIDCREISQEDVDFMD